MYEITKWFLTIKCETFEEFYKLYDEAMKQIPDNALNKKWHRSPRRHLCGREYGIYIFIIGLNKPTLKKIIENP